jgi:hypothetical protein
MKDSLNGTASESHRGLIGKLRANVQAHEYKEFSWHGFSENGAKSQSQPTHSLIGRWSRSLFNPLFLKLFIRPGSWNKDVIFTDIGGLARIQQTGILDPTGNRLCHRHRYRHASGADVRRTLPAASRCRSKNPRSLQTFLRGRHS